MVAYSPSAAKAQPGTASAMKLIRSVFMKGLAALLFESLEAAHRRGMLEVCAEDISATFRRHCVP